MNPLVESIVDEDSILRFTVSNIDVSIINSLRRIILSEIPCFVFRTFPYNKNKAAIEINNTRFNNEIIKQRLACIPIHIKDRSFNFEDHQLEIDINNDSKEILYVTTEDFKIKNKTNNSYLSESALRSIFPPNSITNEYIDFLRLQPQLAETIPGEQIKLTCDFDIGIAKENGAYNVVSTCSFGGTIDPELIEEKWLEKQKTLTDEDKEELEFIKKDWLLIEGARLVKKNSFDFIIKSLGIYDNFELLTLGCDIMIEKFTKFIGDLQGKNIIKESHNTLTNSYDIKLENESFTLGKTLEYILYTKYFGKDIKFVGFRQPHPHIPECLLKIGFNQEVDNEIPNQFIDSLQDKIFSNILDAAKNMEFSENNNNDNINKNTTDVQVDLTEFSKIIIDFLNDLTNTFPEIIDKLDNNLTIVLDNKNRSKEDLDEALKEIYLYCQNFYPERFFDILYQNDSVFENQDKKNEFLPGLEFSHLYKLDISDQTKKTIWKYIQLILFTVVTNVKNDNCFGETAKLFEAIGQDEFKSKITQTMEEMQKVFENNKDNTDGVNFDNLPNPNEIHEHINGLMDGKLGKLAKEIADDTAAELDIDPDNVKDVGDVFQKLFKDPSKLMGIVKNVGSKLDEKMKSGELKESELIQEATDMMGKMQNLPGMDKMGDIFNKLNIPNMGGNQKFNQGAFDQMMQNNLKRAKTKERMKAKLDANKQSESESKKNNQSELDQVNENLLKLMKDLDIDNIPDIMNQINQQNKNNNTSQKPKKKKAKSGNKK